MSPQIDTQSSIFQCGLKYAKFFVYIPSFLTVQDYKSPYFTPWALAKYGLGSAGGEFLGDESSSQGSRLGIWRGAPRVAIHGEHRAPFRPAGVEGIEVLMAPFGDPLTLEDHRIRALVVDEVLQSEGRRHKIAG
jgi:hypothetical protein